MLLLNISFSLPAIDLGEFCLSSREDASGSGSNSAASRISCPARSRGAPTNLRSGKFFSPEKYTFRIVPNYQSMGN